ncbi:DUF309 domain-containing protein [Nocardioides aurantiacus]|uniref:DUF309 domain-containing protein n=1 Tax=Nocardioides aurantiacus TaxID=86796 RepID=UPI00403F32F7
MRTTARDAMLTRPTVHPADLTVGAAHVALEDPHVHLLLLVEDGRLVGTLDRADLERADHADQPAREVAGLEGRTTAPDAEVGSLVAAMTATGRRRLAVVDAAGTLLGLLCLKRSGGGFCDDAGVAARRRERRRDRDPEGRARQARPRDALGRPLPYGETGVEPVPEDPLPPLETVARARELLAEGRPFSAHEVLEARWKDAPEAERPLWQGLAQLCVALTHAARGNAVGAARLLERGAGRVEEYAATGGPTYGVDLAAELACARDRVGG